jgi:hypothetical protein
MYLEHDQKSLPLIANVFAKYDGEEEALYEVVCGKFKIAPDLALQQHTADPSAQPQSAAKRLKTSDAAVAPPTNAAALDFSMPDAAPAPTAATHALASAVAPGIAGRVVPNNGGADLSTNAEEIVRSTRKKKKLEADETTFADLRERWEPLDPSDVPQRQVRPQRYSSLRRRMVAPHPTPGAVAPLARGRTLWHLREGAVHWNALHESISRA